MIDGDRDNRPPEGWDKVEGGARTAAGWAEQIKDLNDRLRAREKALETPRDKIKQAIEKLQERSRARHRGGFER